MARRADDLTLDDVAPEISWEEYLRLEVPAGLRLELESGRLIVSPTGTAIHDVLRGLLFALLAEYEERSDACFVIDEHSFFMPPSERDFQPDVAVITDDRPIEPDGWISGAPSIAIEVLSKSSRARDLGLKARRYFSEGSAEYWTFDPHPEQALFRRRGPDGWIEVAAEDGCYRTPLLPGFELQLPALWSRLRRKLERRR